MTVLAYAAAAIMALLGVMHFAYTLHDCVRQPRFFRPTDANLLDAMRLSRTAIAPVGRDYWSGVLGFNFSHSIGVLLFALLIAITTQNMITWLKPVLIAVAAIYALISYRCWFIGPTIGILLATALLVLGWFI
jgi:hypothetical protein